MVVPTAITIKYSFLLENAFSKVPFCLSRNTGVGKSVIISAFIDKLGKDEILPLVMNFSAQTTYCQSNPRSCGVKAGKKRKKMALDANYLYFSCRLYR
jgi:hypothetical protein